MTGTAIPFIKMQWFDANGDPLSGGKLFCYAAGTSTKQNTYSDAGLTTPNTNPVVLDSAGRASVFLSATSYKFVMAPSTDTDPPASPLWTVDNVQAVPSTSGSVDVAATYGEGVTAGQVVYLSDGSGGKTQGRWYKADSANTYSSSLAAFVGITLSDGTAGTTGTVRIIGQATNQSGLTAGTVYYIGTSGAVTSTAPSNMRAILMADGTTSGIVNPSQFSDVQMGNVNANRFAFKPGSDSGYDAAASGVLYCNGINTQGSAGTSEQTIYTYSLPANVFGGSSGSILRVKGDFELAANANTKTVKFYFGTNSITLANGALNGAQYAFDLAVKDTGSNAQVVRGMLWEATLATANAYLASSPSENTSSPITIKVTVQGGTTGQDITWLWLTIEYLKFKTS